MARNSSLGRDVERRRREGKCPYRLQTAGTNVTDDPRWTYIVNHADACWNGGPADAFQTDGLMVHKELDDGRLPVIGYLQKNLRAGDKK